MKKAQIQHVFLYLFALLIIGALVVIGYKAFTKISSAGCDADKETFKSELLSLIEQYDSRGSYHEEKIHAPCAYRQVCFIDADALIGNPIQGIDTSAPNILQDAQATQSRTNVFLNKQTSWESAGFSDKIETGPDPSGFDPNFACIPAKGGVFKIQFTGLGRRTRIETPSP